MPKKNTIQLNEPSAKEIEKYLKKWKGSNYDAQDRALDLLFKKFPKNNNLDTVLLKACCVNKFYSTNIYDVYRVSQNIVSADTDKRLKANDITLVDSIASCEMSNGKKMDFYVFATKYCHCSHKRDDVFPIYDKFAAKMLYELNNQYLFAGAKFTKKSLENYAKYRKTLETLRNHFKLNKFTLKQIDIYLWQAGKEYFSNKK